MLFQVALQQVHVLHRRVAGHKASEPPAGRIVDHVDQQDLFPASFQPVVIAGVPLHQLAKTAAPRTPFMDLLDPLLPRSPQLGLDHPLPHRLPAHLNFVFLGQVLRGQRRPESPIHRPARESLPPPVRVSAADLAVGRKSSQARAPRPCRRAASAARSRRLTCRSVIPSSSAACFCVISFFFAFFRATRRSRSACVISSCPSATSPAWRSSIGHFYFAQIGHYHFAATKWAECLTAYGS